MNSGIHSENGTHIIKSSVMATSTGLKATFGVIAFLSIVSNVSLCVVIAKHRSVLKNPYNKLILALAITDFLSGFAIISTPVYIIGTVQAPSGASGEFFCRVFNSGWFFFTLGIVSVYTVTTLAFERWFAITKPLTYRTKFKPSRVIAYLVAIWLLSFLFNSPHLFEIRLISSNGTTKCDWNSLVEGGGRKAVAFFEFSFKFFIPLVLSFVTLLHLRYKVKQSPALYQTNKGRSGIRLLRMCALVTTIFAICWLPNQALYFFFKFDMAELDTPLHHFTVVLCAFNSCVNPWIYCLSNKTYRRYYADLLIKTRNTLTAGLSSVDSASNVGPSVIHNTRIEKDHDTTDTAL